jgi:hypothetical protein
LYAYLDNEFVARQDTKEIHMKTSVLWLCVFYLIWGAFLSVTANDISFDPEDFEGHDAVILEAKGYFNDKYTRELSRETYTYKIGFVTRKGIEDHGEYSLVFNPSRENVSDVGGTVYLPNGDTVRIGRSEVLRKPVIRRGRSKLTEVKIAFPALDIGAVVEFTYSRSFTGLRQLSYWPFQNDLYTLHSEVTFIPWYGYHWGYSVTNVIEEPEIHETRPGGSPAHTFTRKNIPALEKENHSLAYSCLREAISMFYKDSHVDSETFWTSETQRIYKDHYRKFMRANRASGKVVSDAINTDDYQSDEALLFAVYDYVKDNYVSLSMLSRQEQENVSDSDRKRLGKVRNLGQLLKHTYVSDIQMNFILAALINTALPKADVYLAFCLPWNEGFFDLHTQSFHQFTETMLKVTLNDKSWWFSPAKRYMPPNMTEWGVRGTRVFLLGDGVSTFEQVPLDDPSDNFLNTVSEITFDLEEGFATITQRTEFDRYESYDLRAAFMYFSEQEREELLETRAKDRFGDEVEIIEYSVENIESISEPLILTLECTFPYEFEDAGDFLLMDMPGLVFPRTNPFDKDERHSRIMFDYPYTEHREITWKLPEGYVIKSHPRHVRVNTSRDPLMYRITYDKIDDRQLQATWQEVLRGNMLRKEAANFLKVTYNQIMQAGNQHVVVERESTE